MLREKLRHAEQSEKQEFEQEIKKRMHEQTTLKMKQHHHRITTAEQGVKDIEKNAEESV